jgi:hypothetical protein
MNGYLAIAQGGQLALIVVDQDYLMSKVRKASACY